MQAHIRAFYVKDVLDICKNNQDTSWWSVSLRPQITWDIILGNPHLPWNWEAVSCNPNITIDIIKNNPNKPWNWCSISKNKSITWDVIIANPDLPWNWKYVSSNPNITIEIVKSNPDRHWDLSELGVNENITIQVILENASMQWNWHRVTVYNPNMTWDCRRGHPNLPWKDYGFVWKPNIDWNEIKRNPQMTLPTMSTWDWIMISRHHCITFDIIMRNPDRAWNWAFIGENPNISLKHVEDNPDKGWDWRCISSNPNIFKCSPTRSVVNEMKRWHSSCVIQRYWFRCVTNPDYKMCRKRLLCELAEMALV